MGLKLTYVEVGYGALCTDKLSAIAMRLQVLVEAAELAGEVGAEDHGTAEEVFRAVAVIVHLEVPGPREPLLAARPVAGQGFLVMRQFVRVILCHGPGYYPTSRALPWSSVSQIYVMPERGTLIKCVFLTEWATEVVDQNVVLSRQMSFKRLDFLGLIFAFGTIFFFHIPTYEILSHHVVFNVMLS